MESCRQTGLSLHGTSGPGTQIRAEGVSLAPREKRDLHIRTSIPASGRGAEQGQGKYNCLEALWVSVL